MPDENPLLTYTKLAVELAELGTQAEDSDELRDKMDIAWQAMSEEELEFSRRLSAQLKDASDGPTRTPFTGYLDVSDEHRASSENIARIFTPAFTAAKLLAPTVDTAILSSTLQQLAAQATDEQSSKPAKIVRAMFNGKTPTGQGASLMLAQLLQRLYSSPYDGLNSAALDFINILVPAIDAASHTLKPPKHGGLAKGKRPS